MNRLLGFILRIVSLIMIGLIAVANTAGIPAWCSVLMLVVSFVCFFFSTKMIR